VVSRNLPAVIATVLLPLTAPIYAADSALKTLAMSMKPGTWAALATKGLDDSLIRVPPGHILQWTDRAVWDPGSKKIFFVGGAHAPEANKKFITYDDATNSWKQEPRPFWFCVGDGGSCIMHAYDHNALNPLDGEFYHHPMGSTNLYKYTIGTGAWSAMPNLPENVGCCVGMTFFPERKGLFLNGGPNALFYTNNTQKWSTLSTTIKDGTYNNFALYNPVLKHIIFGGGNGSSDIYKYDAEGKITALKPAPIQMGIMQSSNAVDPVTGKYLIFAWNGTAWKDFYVYDAQNDTWAKQTGENPINKDTDINTGMISTAIPEYGVVFYLKYNYGKPEVFLYRHADGVNPTALVGRRTGLARPQSAIPGRPVGFYDVRGSLVNQWSWSQWETMTGIPGHAGFTIAKQQGPGGRVLSAGCPQTP
jgi:hypothetical protein